MHAGRNPHGALWMLAGLPALALTAALALAGGAHGLMLRPVHTPFPNAHLAQQSAHITPADAAAVHRRYLIHAPYHEVVQWYQGKDSLLPVARGVHAGCFSQTFRARPAPILPQAFGVAAELVTVCATSGGVSVESVTRLRLPALPVLWP